MDKRSTGTEKRSKGMEKRSKGMDKRSKGMEKRSKGFEKRSKGTTDASHHRLPSNTDSQVVRCDRQRRAWMKTPTSDWRVGCMV